MNSSLFCSYGIKSLISSATSTSVSLGALKTGCLVIYSTEIEAISIFYSNLAYLTILLGFNIGTLWICVISSYCLSNFHSKSGFPSASLALVAMLMFPCSKSNETKNFLNAAFLASLLASLNIELMTVSFSKSSKTLLNF